MAFCKEYNAATQEKIGTVIPVEITVYEVSRLGCFSSLVASLLLSLCILGRFRSAKLSG